MVTSAGCVVRGGGDSGDMISVAGAGVGVVAAEGKVARVAESSTIIGFFFVLEVELPIGILSYDEGGYGVVNKPRGLTGEMMIVPYAVLPDLVHAAGGEKSDKGREQKSPASLHPKVRGDLVVTWHSFSRAIQTRRSVSNLINLDFP